MKRLWRIFLLAAALIAVLCVSAMAADEPTVAGLYGFTPATDVNVTITPYTAESETAIQANEGFYENAVRFDVTYTNTAITAGEQYLLLVCSGEGAPSESNIVYINQKASVAGSVTFDGLDCAYPSSLGKGHYRIYVVGAHSAYTQATPTATFKYHVPYTLGDVDEDTFVTAADAAMILRHVAQLDTLTGSKALAANVDGDNYITSADAAMVLRYVAQLIQEF